MTEAISISAPPCPSDQFSMEWDAGIGEPLVCHLEFNPEELGDREPVSGLLLTPSREAHCDLRAAYVRGLDISALMAPNLVQAIEILAMAHVKHEAEQLSIQDAE